MRKSEVSSGGTYVAKVSGKLTEVRIVGEAVYGNGWEAVNVRTGRQIRVKSAAKLRSRVDV